MAWEADYTWISGELLKLDGRLFIVLANVDRGRVVLADENGRVRILNADAVKSLHRPSREEMSRFPGSLQRSLQRSIRRQQRASQASAILEGWAAVLPARIVNEELGDYLEDIHRRVKAGQRSWVVVRVMTAIFWTGVNAWGYLINQLRRRKTT